MTDKKRGRIRVLSELPTSGRYPFFVVPTEVEGSRAVRGAQAKTCASASRRERSSKPCAEHRLRLEDEARSLDSARDDGQERAGSILRFAQSL